MRLSNKPDTTVCKYLSKSPNASPCTVTCVSILCGIDFAMSLFIGGHAFQGPDEPFERQLKLDVLGSSVVAGVLDTLLLRLIPSARR